MKVILEQEVARLRYLAEQGTFEEWLQATASEELPTGYRWGQHLFNSAPPHIREAVRTNPWLDPFHVQTNERMYIINNFLTLCELIWDVLDPEEINLAVRMVLAEPNARR